jgi:hypothetical protein
MEAEHPDEQLSHWEPQPGQTAQALATYVAEADDVLSLIEGERVYVIGEFRKMPFKVLLIIPLAVPDIVRNSAGLTGSSRTRAAFSAVL